MSTTGPICVLIASLMLGCATTDAPTSTQLSLDERWAQGLSLDTGLAGTLVVLNLSCRGDKDVAQARELLGKDQ